MNDIKLILQARMGSTRLPGKVFMELLGKPLLFWQIESLKKLNFPVIVATSDRRKDDCIEELALQQGVFCVRGSEENVFERFQRVAEYYPAKSYVRTTGDCPLISPVVISKVINLHLQSSADYTSNTIVRSFPDGLDVEVFTDQAFANLKKMELTDYQKEHVTPGFYENPNHFKLINLLEERNLGHWRWTIDVPSDFTWLKSMLNSMGATEIPEYEQIFQFITKNPEFLRLQRDLGDVQQI